jgi:hypothetical protein
MRSVVVLPAPSVRPDQNLTSRNGQVQMVHRSQVRSGASNPRLDDRVHLLRGDLGVGRHIGFQFLVRIVQIDFYPLHKLDALSFV